MRLFYYYGMDDQVENKNLSYCLVLVKKIFHFQRMWVDQPFSLTEIYKV